MKAKDLSTLLSVFVLAGVLTACACQTNVPVKPDVPDPDPVFVPLVVDDGSAGSGADDGTSPDDVTGSGMPDADLDSVFYFRLDDATVPSSNFAALRMHAEQLRRNPSWRIVIEGHCDERGTREYNLALGDRRAEAVQSFLLSAGAASEQIETVSFGEEKPVDTESNEAAWALNRRAEIMYQ